MHGRVGERANGQGGEGHGQATHHATPEVRPSRLSLAQDWRGECACPRELGGGRARRRAAQAADAGPRSRLTTRVLTAAAGDGRDSGRTRWQRGGWLEHEVFDDVTALVGLAGAKRGGDRIGAWGRVTGLPRHFRIFSSLRIRTQAGRYLSQSKRAAHMVVKDGMMEYCWEGDELRKGWGWILFSRK